MMVAEHLEELLSRQFKKINIEKVEVRSLNDIKRIISQLDPKSQQPEPIVNIQTKVNDMNVTCATKSKSMREHIIEGLDIIKKCNEIKTEAEEIIINGRIFKPKLFVTKESKYWVDNVIKRWFDAYRDGLHICWRINNMIYKYDIYQHKLYGDNA